MTGADDRFSSIAGGGLRRRPAITAVPDPEPTTPAPAEKAVSPTTKEKAATNKAAVADRARPRSEDVGGTRRVAFRTPEDLDAKLRSRVAADRTSKVHVILDAVEHVENAGIKLEFPTPGTVKSSLFVRPRTATAATPSIQTEVVLDAASVATLDRLADKHQAPTRTAFVLGCLRQYLD
ncbi:hypothetical protein [Aeromicrobium yanjiei]|uniref:Ribbon-helix-helix protein, CopG family n=1 Tax=Aeromicrobium yanjiei TaxID=2662028 RepID=A0A5Q2M9V0_9ACTN|nr:hypothetical protein [Aeromicrobium yanjiei]QGG39887.1 hypothetical protein GEV26_00010 [Aeromicrobium yanjiei]